MDVTNQVGAKWRELFTDLELRHGLLRDNTAHIWLLHQLFLPIINQELDLFAGGWNQHKIRSADGPARSPEDLYGFDMLVHGVRGTHLQENMPDEEMEVYGVDWEGLDDDDLRRSREENNNQQEGASSWFGHTGAPDHLNEVPVDAPDAPIDPEDVATLHDFIGALPAGADDASLTRKWVETLAYLQQYYGEVF